jgi:hypothetical protein
MKFVYATGGREKYFKADNVGDCVTRAICNATGKDYKEVYDRLNQMAKKESVKRHRGHKRSEARNGVFKETWKRYLAEIGWVHHSTCAIGSRSDKVKFVDGALPNGVLIVQLSKHLTCLKDGVIYDTYDCSKKEYYDEYGDLVVNDERCVYGYWTAPTEEELKARQEQQAEANRLIAMQKEAIANTKAKVESIKKKYQPNITKLEKKIKELQHKLVIETNRMNREIKKVKEQDGQAFCEKVLEG